MTNTATYGSHADGDTMYLSLLRAPGYAAHPVGDRPLIREDRFVPRIDQGEHIFSFMVCGGDTAQRYNLVEQEALVHNETPYVINAFHGGEGEKIGSFMTVSDPQIVLTAMNRSDRGELVLRLFNASLEACTAQVSIPSMNICQDITLAGSRFQTYVAENGVLTATKPI